MLSCSFIRFSWGNSFLLGPNQVFTSIKLIDRRFNTFLNYDCKYVLGRSPKAQEEKKNVTNHFYNKIILEIFFKVKHQEGSLLIISYLTMAETALSRKVYATST